MHGGGHVRPARATHPRHPGGLRDGGRQGHEEGQRPGHVHEDALEVNSERVCTYLGAYVAVCGCCVGLCNKAAS